MDRIKNIVFNTCIVLNGLLIFLSLFENAIEVPIWLQIGGRLHPMLLHFPVTLVVLVVLWELVVARFALSDKIVVGDWLLLGAATSAVLTALMGVLLSREGGYDPDATALHKWTGVGVSVGLIVWYFLRNDIRKKRLLTVPAGITMLIVVTIAGHEGATITHGENFILAPYQSANKERILIDDANTYANVVHPIFEEKCVGCHNEKKAKGGLVMNPIANLLKGGENGVLWDTLDRELGLMMHHLNLPLEDDGHMPPKGKPQLTENEKKLLYYWIKGGADVTQKVIDLSESDSLRMLAAFFLQTIEEDHYTFDPAPDDVIAQLNSDYRLVEPLALHSPALRVEFFGAAFFKREQVDDLRKVGDQIVSLNLNRMPIQDRDLKVIGGFQNLRKLNLSGTQITGATLNDLTSLKELRQLSITGTEVSADAFTFLSKLENLASLFVWNTALSNDDIEMLRTQFPSIRIESGFKGDTLITKLSPPQLEVAAEVFTTETTLRLKHFVNGAVIRYTLDGTDPDSIDSPEYDGHGINISTPVQLRAQAYLQGWTASDIIFKNIHKAGNRPDSIVLITLPNPDYKGAGGQTLFDSRMGTTNFKTPQWLGYREHSLDMELYFDVPVELSSVTISCLIDLSSYIFPATQFEVWSEDGKGSKNLLATIRPEQPGALKPGYQTSYILKFPATKTKAIKIKGQPVGRLPDWHPGKGDKGWVFMDEIFLN